MLTCPNCQVDYSLEQLHIPTPEPSKAFQVTVVCRCGQVFEATIKSVRRWSRLLLQTRAAATIRRR